MRRWNYLTRVGQPRPAPRPARPSARASERAPAVPPGAEPEPLGRTATGLRRAPARTAGEPTRKERAKAENRGEVDRLVRLTHLGLSRNGAATAAACDRGSARGLGGGSEEEGGQARGRRGESERRVGGELACCVWVGLEPSLGVGRGRKEGAEERRRFWGEREKKGGVPLCSLASSRLGLLAFASLCSLVGFCPLLSADSGGLGSVTIMMRVACCVFVLIN